MVAGNSRFARRVALAIVGLLGLIAAAASPSVAHTVNDFPATRADRTLAAFAKFHIHAHEALRRCAPVVDHKDLTKPDSLIKIVTYDISYMWSNIRSILGPGRDPRRDPKVIAVRIFYGEAVEAMRQALGKRFGGATFASLQALCDAERRMLLRRLPHFRRLHKTIVDGVAQ